MAEQNLEITYIPYGLDEISQLDLMTNLANGVEGYLGSKRWARKDKYRNAWLAAYLDIIGRGLVGASNDSGVWTVNHNGEAIPLDSKSNVEREMYQDAAYYIQLQMAKMTPRKKEEEKKKEDLTPFKFKESFSQLLLNNRFGGDSSLFGDSEQGWNALDARDEKTGLRGTAKRREAMASELEAYLKTIEDGKFNFEGTSFKDENDARTKIQTAINALRNTPEDESDDIPAFNALGLNYRGFFSNGGNEASTHLDSNGTPYTYNLWNQLQLQLAEAKAKLEAEKLKQQRANQYSNYKIYNFNLNGTPLTQETSQIILNKLANGLDLDGNDLSGITWAFKLGIKNRGLQNLSKEELLKFGLRYSGTPGRLKKLQGLDGIYYDSIANRIIRPYQNNLQLFGTTLENIINQNSPEAIAKKQLEKIQLANNRKLSEGFLAEDYLRMGAMALDITGAVAAWVPTYGTAISGGLGLSSLATNFAADWNDDSVTVGDMFKNAGINLALAGVGMVPGLGLAAKSGKWLANIAKWTPRILTLASAGHIALSDNIKNSLKKASSVSDWNQLTNQDIKNITYALSTVAGLSRGAKGIVNDRKFKPAFTESTEKQYTITTSKGKKTLTQKLVDDIKKLNPKDKEKYNEELKKVLGLKEDETVNTKDLTTLGKIIKSKGVKIEEENVPVGLSPRAKAYREYLERQNNQAKENHLFLSKYLNTDYDIYKANTQRSAPNLAISDRIRNIWNPLSDRNLLKKGIKVKEETPTTPSTSKTSTETPKITSETSKTTGKKTWTEIEKEPKKWSQSTEAKEYKEMLKGNYSNNAIQGGTHKIGDLTIDVDIPRPGATNGFAEVTFSNGNKQTIRFDNLKQLQKEIAKIVKERRVQTDSSGKKTKVDVKEMSKILKSLKARGFLKQGGTINNPYVDTVIEDFFKNNNI